MPARPKTFTYLFIASSLILFVGAAFYFISFRGGSPSGGKSPGAASQLVLPKLLSSEEPLEPLSNFEGESGPTSSVPIEEPSEEETAPPLSEIETPQTPSPPPSPFVPEPPEEPTSPEPPPPEEPAYQSKTHIVSIENNGFVPKILTITVGDTITWINNDPVLHWPSSDPHPTHTGLPDFDPLSDLLPEESFSYTFIKTGTFSYHDHTQAVEDDEATITGGVRVLPLE